jgi:branched-chain amino acid aminotransferase
LSSSCLDGITRDAVFGICEELNIPLKEETLTRDVLYLADEIFLTGTAAEITPIREVDNRTIGNGAKGDTTDRIQKTFFDIVAGKSPKFKHWLTQI